ncbi:hypothetical protein [Knoellia sp. Soil729]|uniref:hypothetical protein n=1 Tax=Knoellia sp. Soil729 TaxID=1736394 RepID=UPI0006FB2196|nr:hypothetical protein [Knoellia sp. Soil729]KRE42679.1 hypothetical protein ASG74_09880 [Knoellia sp. Soil729]
MSSLSTPVRVVGFIAALAAVFGLTLGVGRLFGPVDTASASAGHNTHSSTKPAPEGDGAATEHAAQLPGGLQVSQDGYTLRLHQNELAAGTASPLLFVIEGPDGAPVTDYVKQHDKDLHLIAVRRDFSGFQHLHPIRSVEGTWSTTVALTPGSWRLFADFAARGAEPMTLGADVNVAGAFTPAATPTADLNTATVDGYTVSLAGELTPGKDSELTLSVSLSGEPVTDLDPYLGAYGHLVALRSGDLAYLHVHPEGTPGDGVTQPGPAISFGASVPSQGTYHLYLDFQHHGVVHTAAFTLTAGSGSATGGSDDHQH